MKKLPEEGDLVLITISKVQDHAAFAKLDEYESLEGMIHVSEFSSSWVRNVKSFLKIGQREVALIIKADLEKKHFNLSLRRVSSKDKTEKFEQIKREKKASKLLEMVSEIVKEKPEKLREKIEKEYTEIYFAFEDAKKKEKLPFSKKLNDAISEIAESGITLQTINVSEKIEIKNPKSDGIVKIKESILKTKKNQPEVNITYMGSPKYKVTLHHNDYKTAEKMMSKFLETLQKNVKSNGGELTILSRK